MWQLLAVAVLVISFLPISAAQLAAVGFGILVLFAFNLIINQEHILYVPVIQNIRTPRDNPEGLRDPSEQGLDYSETTLKVRTNQLNFFCFVSSFILLNMFKKCILFSRNLPDTMLYNHQIPFHFAIKDAFVQV
jgi:hypothetical protein